MDASKVSSSQPAQAVKQTQRTEETRRTQERRTEERQTQAQAAQAKKASTYEKPKPTVNGQGQTIGTRLSVTA
jgi:hypothetical protein